MFDGGQLLLALAAILFSIVYVVYVVLDERNKNK